MRSLLWLAAGFVLGMFGLAWLIGARASQEAIRRAERSLERRARANLELVELDREPWFG